MISITKSLIQRYSKGRGQKTRGYSSSLGLQVRAIFSIRKKIVGKISVGNKARSLKKRFVIFEKKNFFSEKL